MACRSKAVDSRENIEGLIMTDQPTVIYIDQSPKLTDDQQAVIDALTEALDEAMAGNIDAVGIVVCMKGGYASAMAGKRAGDLMLGAFDLQCKIREATAGRGDSSRIIRPGRG